MIALQVVLFVLALVYVAVAFYTKTHRHPTGSATPPWYRATWRRDLTAHEIKIYREMQAHWRREARKTYRRINYDKNLKYGNTNKK